MNYWRDGLLTVWAAYILAGQSMTFVAAYFAVRPSLKSLTEAERNIGIQGQTFLEKETTYIANVPETYVRITSGLGDLKRLILGSL